MRSWLPLPEAHGIDCRDSVKSNIPAQLSCHDISGCCGTTIPAESGGVINLIGLTSFEGTGGALTLEK